jgi:hypothetical protein
VRRGKYLGTETKIYLGDPEVLHTTVHTSWSQPMYVGLVVGASPYQFEVVGASSKDRGVCPPRDVHAR